MMYICTGNIKFLRTVIQTTVLGTNDKKIIDSGEKMIQRNLDEQCCTNKLYSSNQFVGKVSVLYM